MDTQTMQFPTSQRNRKLKQTHEWNFRFYNVLHIINYFSYQLFACQNTSIGDNKHKSNSGSILCHYNFSSLSQLCQNVQHEEKSVPS